MVKTTRKKRWIEKLFVRSINQDKLKKSIETLRVKEIKLETAEEKHFLLFQDNETKQGAYF